MRMQTPQSERERSSLKGRVSRLFSEFLMTRVTGSGSCDRRLDSVSPQSRCWPSGWGWLPALTRS